MKPSKEFIENMIDSYNRNSWSHRGDSEKYSYESLVELIEETYQAGYERAIIELGD